MPVYTSEALILRTYKLGEVDRIVVVEGERHCIVSQAANW